jgi:hypothetical protein
MIVPVKSRYIIHMCANIIAVTMKSRPAALFALGALLVAVAILPTLGGKVAQAQPTGGMREGMGMSDNMSAYVSDKRMVANGVVSSIQTGTDGKDWLVHGTWRMVLAPKPAPDKGASPDVTFRASFTMIMKDGTAKHSHTITNFQLVNWSSTGKDMTFAGTATVSMRDGPHENVPVTIKVLNKEVIEITIDRNVIDHFGSSPIYGLVARIR